MEILQAVDHGINPLRKLANNIASPLFDLAARLYLGHAFFKSGLLRFKDWQNGNFSNQVFLFEHEHPVPGLDPTTAAYAATAGELILPVMLVLGLFGRVAAAGLLVMTAIIEFTYVHSTDHILWAFLAGMIFLKGAGKLSLDALLLKWIR